MSFSSAFQAPARAAIHAGRGLFSGRSVFTALQYTAVALGAGMLAATYQVAYDEGRMLISNMRSATALRQRRNDTLALMFCATALPLPMRERLRRSRDAFHTALAILNEPETDLQDAAILRDVLVRVMNQEGTPLPLA